MGNDIFSFEEYRKFIKYLKSNYNLSLFRNWKGENNILIRHDVDLDLFFAEELAEIEDKCGIQSTYFVMVSSQFYNINSQRNRRILNKIVNYGHEIGLHFDPVIYEGADSELEIKAKQESRVIENVIEEKIVSISLHNPSIHNNYIRFNDFISAYDKKIFNNEIYISDSCMNFRGKDIYKFVERSKKMPVQILLHPLHYSDNGDKYDKIFQRKINYDIENLSSEFSVNSTFKKTFGKSLPKWVL